MAAVDVVGRETELAAIRALLGNRTGGLRLTGEPGIGKTVLWEAGVRRAQDEGWRVLAHRSARAEASLAFAGFSDLVGPVFDEVADALSPPRRHALEVALLLTESGQDPPDARTLGLALLDLLRELSSQAPVLVALDDVQWLDTASAEVIGIAVRRLQGVPVSILSTRRTSAGEARADDPFAASCADLPVSPLGLPALRELLRVQLGSAPQRHVLAAIHRASGGNPYFATELARVGVDVGGVRIPPSLQELLGGRLARLSPRTRDVVLEAAALARPTVDLLADDLEALDAAVVDGILRIDDQTVRFVHPLLASIAYDAAPPGKRRSVHARLAERVRDPEERARHRALAAGDMLDSALAVELEDAGRHAAARGAPAIAADLTEMAVWHTPEAEVDARLARRRAAAALRQVAGDLDRAAAMYDDLIAELPPGPDRAGVLYASATLQLRDTEERIAQCRQALQEAADDDALASHALGFLAINRWISGDVGRGLVDARAALARAERVGDPRLVATAIARVALLEQWQLDVTPGLLEGGVEIERTLSEPLRFGESPSFALIVRLLLSDRLDEARDLVARLAAAAQRRGDEQSRGWHVMEGIHIERHAGRYVQAIEFSETTLAIAEEIGDPQLLCMHCAFTAAVLAEQGRDEETAEMVDRGLELVGQMGDPDTRWMLLGARGHLALSRGDLAAAFEDLRGVVEQALAAGHLHPQSLPWADVIETLVARGELDEAADRLRTFEDLARRTNRLARIAAARCRGLLLLARGDDSGALRAFEASLAEEGGTYPLERGRALLAAGVAHRRGRRTRLARETLQRAAEVFEDLGAAAWHQRAVTELKGLSGRRAHGDELTDAEQRVAALAAQGRQNKEIAAELYLTVGTVEMHLSRVYRKLGVRSRTELAGLARDAG